MPDAGDATTALSERLFAAALGGFDLLCIHIGDRLGLYRALADHGPMTAAQLAQEAGVHPRYAREWLEQQSVSGLLEADADGAEHRFSLPAAHAPVLLDSTSLAFMVPMAQLFVACARPIDAVIDAFRSGEGVPYADYGADLHEGQARFTHPLFHHELADAWLAKAPAIHERLGDGSPSRVADLACGQGRSTIAIAAAYPDARVDGIDLDAASIAAARRILDDAPADVAARVTFTRKDAAEAGPEGAYDLVTIFEALHDMSYPVATLAAARRLVGADGVVLIGDERTSERFDPAAGDLERLYYGFSVTHCLPVGMVGAGAAGTGTVMRADTVRRYATEAGFGHVEVLPIENEFWRFYLLRA